MTPEWGTSMHTLPAETQFLLLELEDEAAAAGSSNGSSTAEPRYAIVLPLIDGDFRGTLRPNRCASHLLFCFAIYGGFLAVMHLGGMS